MVKIANPLLVASKAKGMITLIKRAGSIMKRYGFMSTTMDRALAGYSKVLRRFDCSATFPITAVTLKRHSNTITKYLNENIEFAVHGYTHVDYSQLSLEKQIDHLSRAHKIFTALGMNPVGFRSPYLKQDNHLYTAVEAAGFSYISNQSILWNELNTSFFSPFSIDVYKRALAFYDPWRAGERLSLPQQKERLVEIPVALPDDEILIERLGGKSDFIKETWSRILSLTHQHGELFTLQLHPERLDLCAEALSAVLAEARDLTPKVWFARMDEIAAWWKARARATIEIIQIGDGKYDCVVNGPNEATVLVRSAEVDAPCEYWMDGYREVKSRHFILKSPLYPVIGISPSTPESLVAFLRQQGYFVEINQEQKGYSYYIHQKNFDAVQEQSILSQIEQSWCPIVRLGRWPDGAGSALCVSGDIDAFTLWDYGFRLIGK